MIRLIEALNYRCLHYIRQPLGPFHILVGPNASGKTTFLDVISFLSRMVSDGLDAALEERTSNFSDLTWGRGRSFFELALEAAIPEDRKRSLKKKFDILRYEVKIGVDDETKEVGILEEKVTLSKLKSDIKKGAQMEFPFPKEPLVPSSIFLKAKDKQSVLRKNEKGNDNYYSEIRGESGGKGWIPSYRLGRRKSALANLPEDESRFPVTTWFKNLLQEGVQKLILNSLLIRKSSPPGQIRGFKTDGSNLPWVIDDLKKRSFPQFNAWIEHIRTALPDISDIQIIEREEDKHKYLEICYQTGLRIPSWMASDGTLRLLALTLPAYLNDIKGIYLIEEPENGIHPSASETVFQSLSSVYGAQLLLATHSPVILSHASQDQVLCFKKAESGATDIVLGTDHPQLKNWKGQPNLDVLFASGILG